MSNTSSVALDEICTKTDIQDHESVRTAIGDFHSNTEQEVIELARTITNASSAGQGLAEAGNPSQGSKDPQLDPHSEQFNYQGWIRSVLSITSRDPDRYPQRTAGISFRNLNVFGYGKSTDHQKNVGNVLLDIPRLIAGLLGSKGRRIDILRDFEGVLRASEMLVVLGRPGSGCTTLLKTISGETHGFWVEKSAKINYQGIPWKTMHRDFRGEVVYNAETDVHFPNLTVGETLSFAAQARTPRTRLPGISRDMWAEHMKDVIMTVFSLTHTVNTRVGNDFIRGVSGGERKRVSTAEVALSGSPLQCWDNSTRGLDSATALEFVKTVRLSTTYMGATAVVAIYQASQTIYDIFDKAVVLYEARQIYLGRTDDAKRFFVDMGFHCPERQTTADFLTSLTNPAERKIRPGFESEVPRTPDEFARAWKESAERKLLLEDIDQFDGEFPIGGNQLAMFRKARRSQQARGVPSHSPYTLSTPMQVRLCLVRGFQRLRGDMSLALTTIFGNFIMALIISSIFYNPPRNTASFYSRGALLFFAILLNAFSSALEILTLWVQRPIVEKHSRMAFYRPLSEAISSIICDLPQKVITSISFNLVLYFMTNLRRTVDGFFIFLLFSFMCTLAMSMISRTIGALSRTISQAMAPASLLMLSLVIYTGFTIPTSGMKAWFRWINYLDPIGYAFESLMVNEFAGQEYPCSVYLPTGPDYTNVSTYEHVCATTGARSGSDVVYGSNYLSDSFKYSRAHLWRNLGIVIGFICFFFATYITATECVTAAKSKGEVLVFRRGHLPHKMKEVDDEESTSDPHPEAKLSLHRTVTFQDRAVSAIQKQTAVFHWEDVCYDISIKGKPRRLLNNANGWVEPGTLTALVGASGAGKTTLLDVLASRVTMGVVSGSMLVDGHHRDSSFQRERDTFSSNAMLRQPQHISKVDKVAYVEEVIRLLEMELYADAVVGVPGEGLNVEQRKRLTIGVELAAKPELLLFLDEPTSGLDSQTAWSICTLFRKLAKNGLLFLAEGGQTVYFGDIGKNSDTLIHYFERNGAPPCPPDANPAEWILDVIGAAPGAVAVKDFVKVWNESPELIAIKTELARKHENVKPIYSNVAVDNNSLRPFATPSWYQYIICTHRVFQQYWRIPSYIYSKLILGMLTALFIGFSFYKADNTLQGLQNQMFSIFMLMIIFGNVVNQTMPHFVTQRSLYEVRERPAKVYSWQAFMLANITAELPWNTLMGALIFFCYYYPVGMQRNAHETNTVTERGALFFLFVWSFLMFTSTFTDMIIAGIEVAETGGNIAIMLFSLTLLFCGVLAGPNDFPHFWIFMYRVSPFTYLVDGMMSTGLANAAATCSTVEISVFNPANGTTCGEYMKSYIALAGGTVLNPDATSDCRFCSITSTNVFLTKVNSAYSHRWRNLGIYWVYILFNIIGALFLYWLARVPKGAKARNI